jgi:hypothetical protein
VAGKAEGKGNSQSEETMLRIGCIITGCRAVFPELFQSRWGDLHRVEGVWVFNANGCSWEHNSGDDFAGDKCLVVEGNFWLEVNHVIVVPERFAKLNKAAMDYVLGSPL